jgi:prepilin-type N-terminal cleavage/methylation domain-containing protein
MTHKFKTGFTLIELLVVVAIISILVALLMPSLQRAKESGRRAACTDNMRQIGMALQMYCDDNEGTFPFFYSYDGYDHYWPTTGNFRSSYAGSPKIFRCPSINLNDPGYAQMFGSYQTHYCLNDFVTNWKGPSDQGGLGYRSRWLGGAWISPIARITDIKMPSKAALVGHSLTCSWYLADAFWWTLVPPESARPKPHSQGIVICFLDGHTEWMAKTTLDSMDAALVAAGTFAGLPLNVHQFYFGE